MRSKVRSLRTQFVFPTLRKALAQATRARGGFRVTQFSVQGDHLHLIVEASDRRTLSLGMQGLAIRVAKRVNHLVSRTGKFWSDRFFSRALKSPRVVRNALAYVLNNFRKHASGQRGRGPLIDAYSSAPFFDGFRELHGRAPAELGPRRGLPLVPRGVPPLGPDEDLPVVPAESWLARLGWRRGGTISFAESAPAAP